MARKLTNWYLTNQPQVIGAGLRPSLLQLAETAADLDDLLGIANVVDSMKDMSNKTRRRIKEACDKRLAHWQENGFPKKEKVSPELDDALCAASGLKAPPCVQENTERSEQWLAEMLQPHTPHESNPERPENTQ